jgi:hypothetical protein
MMNITEFNCWSVKFDMKKKLTDWDALYKNLCLVYAAAGHGRKLSVLRNYDGNKKYILQKLNIVSSNDINRVSKEIGLIK